jgi:hypothetical protein
MTRCTVCNSPARAAIEAGLHAGQPKAALARQHGVSRYAIIDHAKAHMPSSTAASHCPRRGAEAPSPAPAPVRDRWAPPQEPCIICAHAQRETIEAILKTGVVRTVISQRWRIPLWAVIQHAQAHMIHVTA